MDHKICPSIEHAETHFMARQYTTISNDNSLCPGLDASDLNKVNHFNHNAKYHSRDIHIDNLDDDKSMKSINFSPERLFEFPSF